MTRVYTQETAPVGETPPAKEGDVFQRGRVKVLANTITLAGQTTSNTIYLGRRPAGSRFLFGLIQSTVTLGSSTIAIGTTGATGKYRAAATYTAVETPTLIGLTTVMDDPALTQDEEVFITIGAAALPSSGTLIVQLFYAEN